jgi:hypothetical protein
MEHITLERGHIAPFARDFYKRVRFYTRQLLDGVPTYGAIALSEPVQRQEQLLGVVLSPVVGSRALMSDSFRAFAELAWALSRRLRPEDPRLRALIAAADPISVVRGAYQLRRGPPALPDYFGIHAHAEQAPHFENRVTLSEQRDDLGQRQPHLHWTIGDQEMHSLKRTVEIVDEELRAARLGRIRRRLSDRYLHQVPDTIHHHMGTTRMDRDPKRGVVDENGRVHGISNLFVAGSSVFPSGGAASVTTSIVALTIRLADHLKRLASAAPPRVESAAGEATAVDGSS